ncbi:MAG: hypothetical protein M1827_006828 [Pycnora praestabilis]|nr:MAG: hypothetical protein M1827_006828 [Pycnora praestabilis]
MTNVDPPLTQYGGSDGAGQIAHFVNDDHLNLFRLNVGWQFLVNGQLESPLNPGNLAKYDALVQACLKTGASCIIDIHNYARWNGAIIGQGGPTNAQFASLWSQIATKYASEAFIVFGIMNEPHNIPNMNLWANSVQAAVTAIRSAGAISQKILLPGNGYFYPTHIGQCERSSSILTFERLSYTAAGSFVSGGSGAALSNVTNPDGSTTNLIFDVHQYLDLDSSGTTSECVTDHVSDAFSPLATWLRANKRQALLSEIGGGNTQSCVTKLCSTLDYLNANSDVYLGYTGWAAGSFNAASYVLALTPTSDGGTWTDTELASQCIVAKFNNGIASLSNGTANGTASSRNGTAAYSRSRVRREKRGVSSPF